LLLLCSLSCIHGFNVGPSLTITKQHHPNLLFAHRFCILANDSGVISALKDRGIVNLVYLIHARLPAVQAAVSHATLCRDSGAGFSYTVMLMPYSLSAAKTLFDEAGLLGDVDIKACPLSFVPLEEDLLSLEAPMAFKEAGCQSNPSCLFEVAHCLTALQASRGAARRIQGIGPWAAAVHRMMANMRREAGVNAPAPGGQQSIDTIILIDRNVDMVTPMCTQLTYEGLLDEILGLSYGQIRGGDAAGAAPSTAGGGASAPATSTASSSTANVSERKITGLNSSDAVFAETRDKFFLGARRWVNETLRSIQHFRDSGMAGADIARLKGFVADLKEKFARISVHTSLMERVGDAMHAPAFAARQKIEAALLDERDDVAAIEDLLMSGEDLIPVLRLLCLYCAVHGGLARRQFDAVRKDVVNTYGHGHMLTLRALRQAGLLCRRDARPRPSFPVVKAQFELLMGEGETVDELDPKDVHFAYAGYAPLSVRIVQHALTKGWSAVESAMAALPGPRFEIVQATNEQGLPVERQEKFAPRGDSHGNEGAKIPGEGLTHGRGLGAASSQRRSRVLVMYIGGVTSAEVSALRFMSRKGLVDCDFVVATTGVINGSTLLASMIPEEARGKGGFGASLTG
jgi:vacuolar protein sorting-associated protein 33A